MLCQIFRSSRKEEMYLYVEKSAGMERVPASLLHKFGEPEPVMMLMLDAKRKLARADTETVLKALCEEGYYLQMPPTAAQLLQRDGSRG
jgi:uncharacterized protein YcgL (UPF0745 family)